MSSRFRVWETDRSIIDPTNMEAWCAVPANTLAMGIGIKGSADVDRLDLYYRYFDPTTVRLIGPEYFIIGGLRPWKGSNYDRVYKPQENGLDMNRTVMLGLALMSSSKENKTTRLTVNVWYLK